MRRIEVILTAITIALAGIGATLWIWRPPLPAAEVVAASRPADSPGRVSTAPAATASAEAVVRGNIFSATRAAPRVRYTPPGTGSEPDAALPGEPAMEGVVIDSPLPRVFGTVTGATGATALFQSDSAGASGRLYREGDRVGQYRIIRINSGSVVVSGPGGRHELKVQSREAER